MSYFSVTHTNRLRCRYALRAVSVLDQKDAAVDRASGVMNLMTPMRRAHKLELASVPALWHNCRVLDLIRPLSPLQVLSLLEFDQ